MKKIKEGLSKIAIKNSGYSLISVLLYKFGGLIFTILIARLLLPELFGIYSLVLSISAIFITFTNLGVDETFLRYASSSLGNKNYKKLRGYFRYLLKIKINLLIVGILIFLLIAKFLSYNVYNNPLLFYPLIFSSLFIIIESLRGFIGKLFLATKNLKPMPFLEFTHQIARISLSLLAILILSSNFKVAGLFLAFSLAGIIIILQVLWILYKENKAFFIGKTESINKKRAKRYLKAMSIASISLVFFSSVDILILGKFVEPSYLAYYRVAFSLILTISSILSLSGILLPIFTQINNKRFKRGFNKTFRYLMILAIPMAFGLFFLSKFAIFITYGKEYLPAVILVYIFSLLIITTPLFDFYSTIFRAKEKEKSLAQATFFALILNIFLTYFLIKNLVIISQEYAIMGAAVATVLSRFSLLGFLMVRTKSKFGIILRKIDVIKPIIAAIPMGVFLFLFNYHIDINLFWGLLEILIGIIIYFSFLFLIKGIGIEEINLIKSFKTKKIKND